MHATRRRLAIAAALALALAGSVLAARGVARDLATARDLHGAAHAGSGECRRCHPSHYESWARTFHRTMTQEATDTAVLGDFDGASLVYGGVTARMERAGGAFEIAFYGPEGLLSRAQVVRAVGSRRMQQYLARDGDVLFRLPVAWHVEEGRWMHMNGAFLTPDPEEPAPGARVSREDYYRHVTRWNDNCVFCHNVAPDPGWDAARERWDTEVAELGVACESCHGPAGEHVRLSSSPVRRYALHLSDARDPTVVNPARLDPARSAEVCGRCHGQRITGDVSRFLAGGDPFVPGDRLDEYSRPLARDTPLGGESGAFAARFWPDGTARLTAYEYQGLLQSACARGGLTCTSCHGMHEGDPQGQLRPSALGDAACTGCHEELAGRAHSRHEAVSCADCHMPRVVYGLVEAHRSHRIDSPDPRGDRPDACTLCHAEETRAWAVRERARLFGETREGISSTSERASSRCRTPTPSRSAAIPSSAPSPPRPSDVTRPSRPTARAPAGSGSSST
ncbi:MAG: ammonia-forming cytochrome c nitrite reductase subunit c552 [Sandaracinaceae bacterium]|nr:ammonia-forming cytochrome c nitrite reductase subunit c552 [Sandaracinaceae bacterium]